MNEFKYEPEAGGRPLLPLDQRDGRSRDDRPHRGQRPPGGRAAARLGSADAGGRVPQRRACRDLQEAVSLRAGANPILVRYDQAGRGYFVLQARRSRLHSSPAARRWR